LAKILLADKVIDIYFVYIRRNNNKYLINMYNKLKNNPITLKRFK